MYQKFFTETLESKFIKNLIYNTALPVYKTVRDGDTVYKGNIYIYKGNLIKCTKSGKLGLEYMYTWNKYTVEDRTYISDIYDYKDYTVYDLDDYYGTHDVVVYLSPYLINGEMPSNAEKILVSFSTYTHDLVHRALSYGRCFVQFVTIIGDAVTASPIMAMERNNRLNLYQDPMRVVCTVASYTTYSVKSKNILIEKVKSNNSTTFPDAGIAEDTTTGVLYYYKLSKTDAGASFEYNSIPGVNYTFGNRYQFTENYISEYSYYEPKLHKYLGKYLRCIRDIYNLNLMPLYNCFSEDYIENFSIDIDHVKEKFASMDIPAGELYELTTSYTVNNAFSNISATQQTSIKWCCTVGDTAYLISDAAVLYKLSYDTANNSITSDLVYTEFEYNTMYYINSKFYVQNSTGTYVANSVADLNSPTKISDNYGCMSSFNNGIIIGNSNPYFTDSTAAFSSITVYNSEHEEVKTVQLPANNYTIFCKGVVLGDILYFLAEQGGSLYLIEYTGGDILTPHSLGIPDVTFFAETQFIEFNDDLLVSGISSRHNTNYYVVSVSNSTPSVTTYQLPNDGLNIATRLFTFKNNLYYYKKFSTTDKYWYKEQHTSSWAVCDTTGNFKRGNYDECVLFNDSFIILPLTLNQTSRSLYLRVEKRLDTNGNWVWNYENRSWILKIKYSKEQWLPSTMFSCMKDYLYSGSPIMKFIGYPKNDSSFSWNVSSTTSNYTVQLTDTSSSHSRTGNLTITFDNNSNTVTISLKNNTDSTAIPNVDAVFHMFTIVPKYTLINSGTNGYKVYQVPIQFNKTYTVALDSDSDTIITAAMIADNHLVTAYNDHKQKINLTKHINAPIINRRKSRFKQPFTFSLPLSINNDNAACIERNERHLYMLIQVPATSDTSIVVLEGDYTHCGHIKYFNGKYEDLDNTVQDTIALSKLSLLKLNDRNTYAFSDRLIEYLTLNVISQVDDIDENVEAVQKCMNVSSFDGVTPGLWSDNLRYYIYLNMLSDNSIEHYDLLGYVDKDVENKYMKGI